jgi:hypothetical protein
MKKRTRVFTRSVYTNPIRETLGGVAVTLYLGIPLKSGIDWGSFGYFEIRGYLDSWLTAACGPGQSVRVFTTNRRHYLSKSDALVYLVGNYDDSVISRVGAPESNELRAGATSIMSRGSDPGMISEVYVNILSNYGAAATVYHELLHNKFQNYLRNIHATSDGNFTSAVAPYSLGGPSAADQALMREALAQESSQCQAGLS